MQDPFQAQFGKKLPAFGQEKEEASAAMQVKKPAPVAERRVDWDSGNLRMKETQVIKGNI